MTTNTAQVLVAKTDIPLGAITGAENFRRQDWPQSALGAGYIQRSGRPNAIKDLAGSVARADAGGRTGHAGQTRQGRRQRSRDEQDSDVIFRNVRVLAIGQLIEARDGKKLAEGN